jgi:DNA-directed RNA polymerase specialized sigma24 family protein
VSPATTIGPGAATDANAIPVALPNDYAENKKRKQTKSRSEELDSMRDFLEQSLGRKPKTPSQKHAQECKSSPIREVVADKTNAAIADVDEEQLSSRVRSRVEYRSLLKLLRAIIKVLAKRFSDDLKEEIPVKDGKKPLALIRYISDRINRRRCWGREIRVMLRECMYLAHRLVAAAILRHLMLPLQPREQTVVILRYGLTVLGEFSSLELSELLSVSTENVRQINSQALEKLRATADREELTGVLTRLLDTMTGPITSAEEINWDSDLLELLIGNDVLRNQNPQFAPKVLA